MEVTPPKREVAALRILQAGAVICVLAASTYKVYELDRFFVAKELVLHLTALVAVLLTMRTFRQTARDPLDNILIGFLLISVVSVLFATNKFLALRALTISASGFGVFWVARVCRDRGWAKPVLSAIAFAVIVGAITSLLQAFGVRSDFFSINRAPGGTLGNRNFVAHMAAFGLPVVLLGAVRAWRAAGYLLGAVGVALVTATLVLTRSRAGWLAAGVAVLVFLVSMVASRPVRRNGRSWGRLAGVLLAIGGGVAGAILIPNSLRWRSENPYLESVRGVANYQEGSGAGRLVQYQRS